MLIDGSIKDLVAAVDETKEHTSPQADRLIRELIKQLRDACQKPENRARYSAYPTCAGDGGTYPLDGDGYAQAFDPLTEEMEFYDHWSRYGFVVGRSVIPKAICDATIARIHELMLALSNRRCDVARPETYANMPHDAAGVPVLSRGFFEIYHDDSLAQLRQSVHTYIHHVVLWGRTDLWTTFDRFGVKLPGHSESYALPLHVDQNPLARPGFQTVQGVLTLGDCPSEQGTFVGVPGSKQYFAEYARMAGHGEYVELHQTDPLAILLQQHAQPIPLRAGNIVSWDSRTTHSNTENISTDARMVAYISAGPARENDAAAIAVREDAFRTGLGSNIRDALMHASKKPRYTDPEQIARVRKPERLSFLGKLLYGKARY